MSSCRSSRSRRIFRTPSRAVHSGSRGGDELARDRVDLAAAGRRADELGTAVGGVGDALDVAVALEVGDELGHRLLRDLGPLGQHADPGALVVEELEDVAVRRAHVGVPALGEPLVQPAEAMRNGSRRSTPRFRGAGAVGAGELVDIDRKPVYLARHQQDSYLSFSPSRRIRMTTAAATTADHLTARRRARLPRHERRQRGALLALEVLMPPGGGPPMLHRHEPAELYRVERGELTFYLGGRGRDRRRSTAGAGRGRRDPRRPRAHGSQRVVAAGARVRGLLARRAVRALRARGGASATSRRPRRRAPGRDHPPARGDPVSAAALDPLERSWAVLLRTRRRAGNWVGTPVNLTVALRARLLRHARGQRQGEAPAQLRRRRGGAEHPARQADRPGPARAGPPAQRRRGTWRRSACSCAGIRSCTASSCRSSSASSEPPTRSTS